MIATMLASLPLAAEEVGLDALAALPPADVTVLGEVHDNPAHHLGQAQAIRAIDPAAVVFEMLTPAQAARVTPDLLGDEAALEAALVWHASGWPDFALYYPVFAVLDDARVFGAALDRGDVRRAVGEGAAAIFGGEAARYGLTEVLPQAEQAEREAAQFAAHCEAMPIEMMGGMVEAQRLRDAALARAVVQARSETSGPVVVIAGNGHARRDWGLLVPLARAAPGLTTLSVAFVEAAQDADAPFDLWIVTAPAEREDPCKAFTKS